MPVRPSSSPGGFRGLSMITSIDRQLTLCYLPNSFDILRFRCGRSTNKYGLVHSSVFLCTHPSSSRCCLSRYMTVSTLPLDRATKPETLHVTYVMSKTFARLNARAIPAKMERTDNMRA
jgi:hypothetical protein